MNGEPELPEEVLTAIQAGRKIEAIKLLRERHSLGLKEAKKLVDAYLAGHPASAASRRGEGGPGIAPLLLAAVATAAAYLLYRYFS
jgi:hypothetical protein